MNIEIDGRNVEMKMSFRSYIIYENIQGKTFAPQTMTDVLVYFYCVIMASASNLQFSFEQFLDMIDENPHLVEEFSTWLTGEIDKNAFLEDQSQNEVKKTQKTKK